jgi:hypothetical protein
MREIANGIGRRALVTAATATPLVFPAIHARAQATGVALVIGNSKYKWEAPLPNVRRDVPDITRAFRAMGLRTELIQDAGRDAMLRAIEKFGADVRGARFAAFYFAGHGIALKRDTFIVPIDSDLSGQNFMDSVIPVTNVSEAMAGAANRLSVFDACRNNPADGAAQLETERAASQNLQGTAARAAQYPNTLFLYSTAPGHIALDGPAGENSPFAAAFLRQLGAPSVDLRALSTRLRRDLLMATQGRQMSFEVNGYTQPFILKGTGAGGTATAPDASRIVELPNAYSFAEQNGVLLPPGLIAFRAPANSPDARKIGAFKFDLREPTSGEVSRRVIIVLSVDKTALVLMAGTRSDGAFWSFRAANVTANGLDLVPRADAPRFVLEWSDANSGSVRLVLDGTGGGGGGGAQLGRGPSGQRGPASQNYGSRFTRLDG